jgi:hypothetical protein
MSGEDAPRPYLENLIVLEIKTNKQTAVRATMYGVRTTKSSGLELLHVQLYICAYVGNKW